MARRLTQADREWRAEEDARTLAEALEITQDARRKVAAVKKAKELARKAEQQAKRLNSVTVRRVKPPVKRKQVNRPRRKL